MTNSDSTAHGAPAAGGHRRRFRPFVKATFAALVASLGVGIFASPAFAHTATVSGVPSCAASTYSITWTITNDFPETETATVQSVTGGLPTLSATTVSVAPTSSGLTSTTITQTLPATASGTISISVLATWPAPSPFSMTATASVTLPTGCFPPAGVTVTKSILSPATPVTLPAGSPTHVVYGLTVKNTSAALATTGGVTITDTIPTGTTYVPGSATCVTGGALPTCNATESGTTVSFAIGSQLAANASYVVSFAVTVDANDPAETIPNLATWSGPGCQPTNDSETCQTNKVYIVVTNPSLTVVKSANTGAVTAGQAAPVVYTLLVSNPANQTSPSPTESGVTVTDVVPSGLTYVSESCGALTASSTPSCTSSYDTTTRTVSYTLGFPIAVGASYPLTFTATVNAGDTASIVNTGSWTGPGCTPAAGTTTCATNTVIITVANFTVSKSDSAGSNSVNPGDVVYYTLSAKNIGTGPGSITVTDAVPTGTTLTTPAPACPANTASTCSVSVTGSSISWVITSLAAGATYDLTFAVKVNAGTGGTHILNTGVFTEPGCTTAGGCSTNTTDNPVPPPTGSGAPPATVPTTPAKPVAIKNATSRPHR